MKQTGLLLLLTLLTLPLAAQEATRQESADTAYVFRFVPEKDVFFVSFSNNQAELNRLCAVLTEHIDLLRAGVTERIASSTIESDLTEALKDFGSSHLPFMLDAELPLPDDKVEGSFSSTITGWTVVENGNITIH